jgi:site-specific DNA-methyltransferase (adenine-specific)
MSNVQIIHGDCMTAMASMKDKEFELAIVDPPYGIGKFTCDKHTDPIKGRVKNIKNYSDDYTWNESTPEKEYFEQLRRVSKERIIWGANYYNCFENNNAAVVWFKGEQTNNVSACEIASLSFQTKVDFIHVNWQAGFYRKLHDIIIHPCQKPVALYQWLLKNYAKPGDRILDTHLGSGSSAIAADIMGFDFVGYEIDEDYYKAALDRFNRHKQQCVLEFA